jgi:hypothetical protein
MFEDASDETVNEAVMNIGLRVVVGLFVDLFLSLIVSMVIAGDGRFIHTMAICFAIIIAIRLFVGFRNWIHGGIWWQFIQRHNLDSIIRRFFLFNKVPRPNGRYDSNLYYFLQRVINNQDLDADIRIKSVTLYVVLMRIRNECSKWELSIVDRTSNKVMVDWMKSLSIL